MIELTFLKVFMLIRQVYHYLYFLDNGFKFHPNVCSGGHNVLMMSMDFSDIAILNTCLVDYRLCY